jgi:hypothetical protein
VISTNPPPLLLFTENLNFKNFKISLLYFSLTDSSQRQANAVALRTVKELNATTTEAKNYTDFKTTLISVIRRSRTWPKPRPSKPIYSYDMLTLQSYNGLLITRRPNINAAVVNVPILGRWSVLSSMQQLALYTTQVSVAQNVYSPTARLKLLPNIIANISDAQPLT